MNNNSLPSHSKNEHIEILRAIAVIFVVVLHIQLVPYYAPGNSFLFIYDYTDLSVGVDLFFVISGFVITNNLVRATADSSNTRGRVIISFWIRRIYRLLPSAWFWLSIVLLYKIIDFGLGGSWDELQRILVSVTAALVNLMNVYAGYCHPGSSIELCVSGTIPHGHYWTLSLEEQFYLLFPLLFFFLNRKSLIGVLLIAIALQFFWKRPAFTLFYFLRTDALCWGILLALASQTVMYLKIKAWFCKHLTATKIVAASVIISLPLISANVLGVFEMKPYGVGLVAFISAIIVLFASFEYGVIAKEKLYYKVMLYIGSRSYAIYITHLIVFAIVEDLNSTYDPGFSSAGAQILFDGCLCLVAMTICWIVSEWNFRFIERPWRLRGREISARILNRTPQASESAPHSVA